MQKAELESILQELYAWDPKLKKKEVELIDLINKMVEAQPNTKFDTCFAESLKKDLLSHRILLDDDERKENYQSFLNNINRKIYLIFAPVAVVGVIVLFIVVSNISTNQKFHSQGELIKAAPLAFGSLAALNSSNNQSLSNSTAVSKPVSKSVAAEDNSDRKESLAAGAKSPQASSLSIAPAGITAKMSATNGRIMAPFSSYKFEYQGDPLNLKEATGTVYRRLKGAGYLSSNLDSLIDSKSFGPINLKSFSNLKTSNLSLAEDKKLGLIINIDFNEENIYLTENWPQWQTDRDQCGDNQNCSDSGRLKITDVPEDAKIIAIADSFLTNHQINRKHYGLPMIDNNWRADYEAAADKANFYIPESIDLIYPLLVDNQNVYDQSGNFDGLRVTVDLFHKVVSGVSNLATYRYETSAYPLETDSANLLNLAVRGGNNNIYYNSGNQSVITLGLGTPTKSLIRYYRYRDNLNEELLIPALIFPIKNAPADYYGSKFITVPLVKEIVDELLKNNEAGGIQPMIK